MATAPNIKEVIRNRNLEKQEAPVEPSIEPKAETPNVKESIANNNTQTPDFSTGKTQREPQEEQSGQLVQPTPPKAPVVKQPEPRTAPREPIGDDVRKQIFMRNRIQGVARPDDIKKGVELGLLGQEEIEIIKQEQPTVFQQYEQARKETNDMETINFGRVTEDEEVASAINVFEQLSNNATKRMQALSDNMISQEELYNKYLNTPEIKDKQETYNKLEAEIIEKQQTMRQIEDDVRAELSGGASESYIQALVNKRSKSIQRDIDNLKDDRYFAQVDMNSSITSAERQMAFELEDQKQQYEIESAIVEQQLGMDMQKFSMAYDALLMDKEQELKESWAKKDLADKISIMESTTAQQQAMMKRERDNGYDNSHLITMRDSDGNSYLYNIETGSIEETFKSDGSIGSSSSIGNMGLNKNVKIPGYTGDLNNFIKDKEGFRSVAYKDSAGVWTLGYGFTELDGIPIMPGQTMTRAQGDELFDKKVQQYTTFTKYINTPLTPEQYTALNSFEYNLGKGIWEKNAMPIIDAINEGDLDTAGEIMLKYVNAGGKYVQGLANRRLAEVGLLKTESDTMGGVDDLDRLTKRWMNSTNTNKDEIMSKLSPEMESAIYERAEQLRISEPLTSSKKAKVANDYRADFEKSAGKQEDALGQINIFDTAYKEYEKKIAEGGSVNIETMGMIFTFMKSLDPDSVVRESEYALSAEGQSILNRMDGMYKKYQDGGAGLAEEEVRSMYNLTKQFSEGYKRSLAQKAIPIINNMAIDGIDINQVFTPGSIEIIMDSGLLETEEYGYDPYQAIIDGTENGTVNMPGGGFYIDFNNITKVE